MSYLFGKKILIIGGTGTFGRALVSRLLTVPEIEKIVVLSRDELKQSEMQREFHDPRLRFFIGDVRDLQRLERAFQDIDVVVHAAALKQVPATEYNPLEAVKTNVIGVQNVIDAALDNNVEKVMFVSSDKAVQPINLYGATKLCGEKLCIAANAYRGKIHKTRFGVIRYGNVLGSRGSLLEVIKQQQLTGVVTLTDERMTRFWITIERVIDNVLKGLEYMAGGETFVPKMRSTRVLDIVKTYAPNCKIKTIGIRPGEKLHETLIAEHEVPRTKDVHGMFVIRPEYDWGDGSVWLQNLPSVSPDFLYTSNNPEFLLSVKEIPQVISV